MNPPVNRSSESPRPSGNQPPEPSNLSMDAVQPLAEETTPESSSETPSPQQPATAPELPSETPSPQRQEPIPPPSHPRQYRAIGLVSGQYQQSEEQMTRGLLVTDDGTAIDAVLLGRVISLVKNHLDLTQSHLWVVYPRTRQNTDQLHVQIVGVWEPETLKQAELLLPKDSQKSPEMEAVADTSHFNSGYFSIRGEVIYAFQEQETVIIKIRQAPKRESDKPKFFKLKLTGTLPDRPVGRFWDLQVQLQKDALTIQGGEDLGFLAKKKPFSKKPTKVLPDKQRKTPFPVSAKPGEPRPVPANRPQLPKPQKRKDEG